jgi:predicted RNA binding protein YcfA (HicA-like mRNA interferase family)
MGGGRLPVVSGKDVVRALTKAGFIINRIAGSHYVLTYPADAARTVNGSCSR